MADTTSVPSGMRGVKAECLGFEQLNKFRGRFFMMEHRKRNQDGPNLMSDFLYANFDQNR